MKEEHFKEKETYEKEILRLADNIRILISSKNGDEISESKITDKDEIHSL